MWGILRNAVVCILLALVCVTNGAARKKRQSDKNGYLFTSPRSLKTGSENELTLQRFGQRDAGVLTIRVFYTENYNGNETMALEKEYEVNEGDKISTFKLYLDPFDNYVYNGRLQMNGTFGKYKIGGSDKIYFNSAKNNIVIVQTDKPLYQPGQDVKFRVLKLDKDLKPSGRSEDLAQVSIEDPKGTKLFQFDDVDVGRGISQREFSLSNEPVLGTWKINVKTETSTDSGTFDVKEYVLPKYQVTVKFPPYVLANAETVPVEVCAKYTYGKNVIGTLNLNSSLESYSWSREKNPVLQETIKLDGCYNYTINISMIEPGNQYRYRRIMVVANVTEDGTGVERKETQYLQREYSPLNIDFESDQRQYFKPGLPYVAKLRVTNPDKTPADGEEIELCATVQRERIVEDYWYGTRKVKVCKNYTSDANGYIQYTLLPQNVDATSIYVEARSTKYVRDNKNPDNRNNLLNQPQSSTSLSPYYSPSGSFIQLAPSGKALPCGTQKDINLLFTSKTDADFKFYYKIIKNGEVVRKGSVQESFQVQDDISKQLESGKNVLKGKEVQLVPQTSSAGETAAPASEDECHTTKEAKYTPPIGKSKISIDIDASLSPSFQLLLYYVRDDRETVADSQKIEVEKCFQNQVEFKFADRVKQPGTNTKINVKAAPNSLCGLKIVDKSISLLDNRDQLTKDKVFQLKQDLDTGYYYSSDPCGETNPQPGLYAKSSIIRPPGPIPPSSSSSYSDSLTAFQDAGYLLMSDLTVFTRPCVRGGGFGGGGPVFETNFAGGPGGDDFDDFITTPAAARKAFARAGPAIISEDGGSNLESAVSVRDYFPETWLFNIKEIGPDGVYDSKEKLPHTITQWDGSAVCVSGDEGLGISDVDSIQGFQAFFLSFTLPPTVVRGEQFWAVISVFSYADASLPVTISVDNLEGFEITSDSIDGQSICVEPSTSQSLRLRLKGTAIGKQNITVRAETSENADACGDAEVSSQVARDAVTNSLEVKAEGFPAQEVTSALFCPADEGGSYSHTFKLETPSDIVPDSGRAIVDLTGNVLGPAIQNIDSLVSLPTGCGEQNMVKFTPNLFVLEYLQDIGQLTDVIRRKAIRNLQTGYQRELKYRHDDGSFSAFGPVDKSGSMFLTAFVLKSFFQAQKYITVDDNVLTSAQNFIVSKQQEDGCFPNVGQIIDHGLQGGIEKEKTSGPVTAYTLTALMMSGYGNGTVINKALGCLENEENLTPYQTFLYAYSDAWVGNNDGAKERLDSIRGTVNKSEGVEYYNNPNGTKALNLETAAYAVLTILKTDGSAQDALPLVRFMTQSLNPNGGFYSTQDTVVGLDALAQFAKLVYKDPVQLSVTYADALRKTLEVNEDNKLLIQRNLVPKLPSQLKVQGSGTGCGLIQVSLRYNTKTPPQKLKFYLEVTGTCSDDSCNKARINARAIYLPEGQKSGMSIVEVKMQSGIVPVKESLNKLVGGPAGVMKVEVENNGVNLYFNEISNAGIAVSFDVEKIVDVENPQPAAAKVYDYYATENEATTSYLIRPGQPAASGPVPSPSDSTSEPSSEVVSYEPISDSSL